jgi:hypothetical protein
MRLVGVGGEGIDVVVVVVVMAGNDRGQPGQGGGGEGERLASVVARLDQALAGAMVGVADPAGALRACCGAYCRFGLDHPGHYQVLFSAHLALDPARPGDRPGERVFGRLVTAVQACIDAGAARQGNADVMAVNIWVALHGIVSLRTSRPNHPWPPVDTLIEAALSGQAGLDD